jgi:hypothetical protein
MIYCGFGFDFGKSFGYGSRQYLATTKICTKSCFFKNRSSIISLGSFPESWPYIFDFLTFFIPFYVGPGSKSGSGTVMHLRSGSCGSDSTTLLIPRNPRCKYESPEKQTLGIKKCLFSISGHLLQSCQISGSKLVITDVHHRLKSGIDTGNIKAQICFNQKIKISF